MEGGDKKKKGEMKKGIAYPQGKNAAPTHGKESQEKSHEGGRKACKTWSPKRDWEKESGRKQAGKPDTPAFDACNAKPSREGCITKRALAQDQRSGTQRDRAVS